MGRGGAAEKLSPEEDPRTSTEGGLSRAGISPHATRRQGVDQPCGIRGSWGCGPALPSVVTRARRRQPGRAGRGLEDGGGGHWRGLVHCGPPASPPPRWHGVSTTLRRQRAAGAAAGAAALAVGGGSQTVAGRQGESCRWQAGKERLRLYPCYNFLQKRRYFLHY